MHLSTSGFHFPDEIFKIFQCRFTSMFQMLWKKTKLCTQVSSLQQALGQFTVCAMSLMTGLSRLWVVTFEEAKDYASNHSKDQSLPHPI